MATPEIPQTMTGVQLTGHGGLEMLSLRDDLPVPQPGPDEVLIKIAAAGINNTDINTRTAWYSKGVTGATNEGGADGFTGAQDEDGSWSGVPLAFPRIQGADGCGEIIACGADVDPVRIGQRVLVRAIQLTPTKGSPFRSWTFGSECDGAFAQYTKTFDAEAFAVDCDWSDAELASVPCAYSTAENMVDRADIRAGETVLITGASGGVGSAAVQLVKRRGAKVIAQAAADKAATIKALGADEVLDRGADLIASLGKESLQAVIDVVGGPAWPALLDLLVFGGRYATAGAIAGPLVELDLRTLYLKDLTFLGCTYQPDHIFPNLVRYIEAGEIRPLVAQTYPLAEIVQAQEDFIAKKHSGKLVLIPPA